MHVMYTLHIPVTHVHVTIPINRAHAESGDTRHFEGNLLNGAQKIYMLVLSAHKT
jgi:hypothetical protein